MSPTSAEVPLKPSCPLELPLHSSRLSGSAPLRWDPPSDVRDPAIERPAGGSICGFLAASMPFRVFLAAPPELGRHVRPGTGILQSVGPERQGCMPVTASRHARSLPAYGKHLNISDDFH
jgi:hypothetical protein